MVSSYMLDIMHHLSVMHEIKMQLLTNTSAPVSVFRVGQTRFSDMLISPMSHLKMEPVGLPIKWPCGNNLMNCCQSIHEDLALRWNVWVAIPENSSKHWAVKMKSSQAFHRFTRTNQQSQSLQINSFKHTSLSPQQNSVESLGFGWHHVIQAFQHSSHFHSLVEGKAQVTKSH